MDEQELAKLLKGAGEDPGFLIGTSSTLNADGTVTIIGQGRSVTAIAQTAFRSGTWSAKRVGNTWYAWSGNAPIVETELKQIKRASPREDPEYIPLKVLFSVEKDGFQFFYVGGDRKKPKEIWRISTARGTDACLENIGKGLNDWVFAVKHWDKSLETSFGGFGLGLTTCKVISPKSKKHNWELTGLPSGLIYIGSGIWVSNGADIPYSAAVDVVAGTVQESTNPDRTMLSWQNRTGYSFPLALTGNALVYSHNIGSAIAWDGRLDTFVGRVTIQNTIVNSVLVSSQAQTQLEYGITPYLKKSILFTKNQPNNEYITALLSFNRRYAMHKRSAVSLTGANFSKTFDKSILLTQYDNSLVEEINLTTADGNDGNIFSIDPISRWLPHNTTLYYPAKKRTNLKGFQVLPTNFFTNQFSLQDLESVKAINPATGKGGVSVWQFVEMDSRLSIREQIDKRIIVPEVQKLTYESDNTLRIWSIVYFPEKAVS